MARLVDLDSQAYPQPGGSAERAREHGGEREARTAPKGRDETSEHGAHGHAETGNGAHRFLIGPGGPRLEPRGRGSTGRSIAVAILAGPGPHRLAVQVAALSRP